MALAETAELAVRLNLEGNFDRRAQGAEKRLERLRRSAAQTGRGIGQIARGLGRVGVVAGAAAAGGLAVAVKGAADFEDAMVKSLAIQGRVGPEIQRTMETTARNVAKTTSFSATEAAEAYFFLASAGLTAEQQIAAMPRVAAFAQAGNFDLATATDLVTDAQSALGLTAQDAAKNLMGLNRVQDVLVKANTLANASVEQFSTSLTRKAGASMRALGIDVEEGVAVLAAFADAGVKGELAGTTFSATVDGLSRAATTNRKEFAKLGIEIFDERGELKNLADVAQILTRRFAGMSDEQRAAAFQQLGLNRNTKTGIELIIGQSDRIRRYERELRNAGGTTDTVANKSLQTFNEQVGLLRDNLKDVGITLGTALLPPLTTAVETIKGIIGDADFSAFADELGSAFAEFVTPENIRAVFDEVSAFVASVDFDAIKSGLSIAGDVFREAVDIFNGLPPGIQAGLVGLLAVNKVSGGLVTSGIGTLARGGGVPVKLIGAAGGVVLAVKLAEQASEALTAAGAEQRRTQERVEGRPGGRDVIGGTRGILRTLREALEPRGEDFLGQALGQSLLSKAGIKFFPGARETTVASLLASSKDIATATDLSKAELQEGFTLQNEILRLSEGHGLLTSEQTALVRADMAVVKERLQTQGVDVAKMPPILTTQSALMRTWQATLEAKEFSPRIVVRPPNINITAYEISERQAKLNGTNRKIAN